MGAPCGRCRGCWISLRLRGERCWSLGAAGAAIPSETEYFVSDRLGLGLPTIGPSQLTGRAEMKQRNVRFYYYRQTSDHHTIQDGEESFPLWSRFPDQRYTDSTATNAGHV